MKKIIKGATAFALALMDAVDVKAYLIHADTNDHQWILTEFDDGFAYIDIDANVSSGFEAIYHTKTHPYMYDTNGLPAIGSHSADYGTKTAVAEGWKQDANGWWYQNADGSYPLNAWKEIGGKKYYFGGKGYMLANTTTPDGYQVDAGGAWMQEQPNCPPQPIGAGVYVITEIKAPAGYTRFKPIPVEIYFDGVYYYMNGMQDSKVKAVIYK